MPWNGGTVVTASEVDVVGSLGEIQIIVDGTGQPMIKYSNPDRTHYAPIIFSQSGTPAVYGLTIQSGDRLNQVANGPVMRDVLLFSGGGTTLGGGTDATQGQTPFGAQLHLDDSHGFLCVRDSTGNTVNARVAVANDGTVPVLGSLIREGATWNNVTLAAGWSHQANNPVQYKKYPDGCVRLRGGAASPATTPNGANLFTLPSGYVPAAGATSEWVAPMPGSNGFQKIMIDTTGAVLLGVGYTSSINLNFSPVSFPTL